MSSLQFQGVGFHRRKKIGAGENENVCESARNKETLIWDLKWNWLKCPQPQVDLVDAKIAALSDGLVYDSWFIVDCLNSKSKQDWVVPVVRVVKVA